MEVHVTSMLPIPSLSVNSFDPVNNILDLDATITNPTNIDAYDIRLIVYTDNIGHLLKNPDNWTHLFDIPEGLWSNPFKAYAKGEQNRVFSGHRNDWV